MLCMANGQNCSGSEDQAFVKASAKRWLAHEAASTGQGFVSPALLMQDDPPNHLDLPAILWLEQWLTGTSC